MKSLSLQNNLCLIHGRDGYFLVNIKDQYIGQSMLAYGEYNKDEALMLNHLIQEGDCVVEVGANIGSHTLALAKRVGAQGKVIAYEPQRYCFSLLQSQLALNEIQNVWAYNLGVAEMAKTLYLPPLNYQLPGNFGGVSLNNNVRTGSEPIQVVSLDQHLDQEKINLIKIDVEGMELNVLKGAEQLIQTYRPILYLENDRLEKSHALLTTIFSLGYQVWWHIPPLFSSENFFNNPQNIFGEIASFNVLCIHKSRQVNIKGLIQIHTPNDPHPLARNASPMISAQHETHLSSPENPLSNLPVPPRKTILH